jgi:hypothetical protein
MAQLISGTTIAGNTAIHTGNIGSYAITSLSGYATQAYVTSSISSLASQTYVANAIANLATQTYVNTQISNLVNAAPGALDTLSELASALGNNASFSTTVTNSIATKLPLAGGTLTGDLLSTHPYYPGYNGASIGSQSSYYLYGDTGNSGIRTNGNFLANGDIYLGTRGNWLSTYLNQNVRTDSAPSFSSVTLGGSSLSGSMVSGLSNMLGVTTLPYSCDITVGGDADKFYAVQFWGGDQDVWRRIIIKRGYSETAPWDPIGTGVHHGGLLLDWEGNFGGWGGAEYSDRLRVFNEQYTNVCADMYIYSHSMSYVFMLRGGGAVYHLFSDQPINGFYQSGAPDILLSSSTLSYDDNWSGTNQYDVYAPTPLTLAQVNSSRIDGLRLKKQSLLDGRYAAISHSHTFASLTSKPTTISGYGITDAITTSNIGSQTVATAGALSSMNISQFTNNSGYLTALPSHNHDDRYYTETESDGRYLYYRGINAENDFQRFQDGVGEIRFDQINDYDNLSNRPSGYRYGGVLSMRGDNFGFQLWGSHTGDFYYKTQWDGDDHTGWRQVITALNIGSQSVDYASSAGSVAWTNVSGRPTALSSFTNNLGNYGGFLTSLGFSYGTGVSANYVVQRDANGYIYGNYYNSTDNTVSSGVTYVMVKQGDNWMRSATAGAIQTFLGLGSMAYAATSSYYSSSNPSGFTSNTGTVTSVGGTGTVSGLTLSGTVTGSGNLTLGGTLSLTSGNVTSALGYTPATSSHDHDGRYVRSYTTSSDNIDSDWGQSFKTFDPVPSGVPPIASANLRTINVGEDFNRRTQLAFTYASDQAWFRRRNESGWQTWREFIHSGNIGSQSVSYATSAGSLTSMNVSQFTNNSGYLTGITYNQVVNALGYTPANSGSAGISQSTADSLYVNITGDTMTGPLTISGSTYGQEVFAVNGLYGRLFTVTDDFSDSIFSANTISGLPVIEAFSDYSVKIGTFNRFNIVTSGDSVAINSNVVDPRFPFYVGDRSTSTSRYYLTNPGMGFNLADNYAQFQLYGPSGAYIDFVYDSGADYNGRIMYTGGAFTLNSSTTIQGTVYTSSHGNSSQWNDKATHRAEGTNYVDYSRYVYNNNAYSGSGWVEPSDLGVRYANSAGSVAWSNVSGRPTALSSFTNDLGNYGGFLTSLPSHTHDYVPLSGGTMTGRLTLKSISGVSQTVPNDYGAYLHLGDWAVGRTAAGAVLVNTAYRADYATDLFDMNISRFTNNAGYITSPGNITKLWAESHAGDYYVRANWTGSYWQLTSNHPSGVQVAYSNDSGYASSAGSAARATRANGNFYIDDNYGNTVVGVYDSYRLQGVFAMGDSYKLAANGTSSSNHYGIAWSHPNAGGTAANLTDHGMLIQTAGVTRTAISNTIWCIGDIIAYSDAKVKDNVKVIDNPLDRLSKVRGVTFTRTDFDDKEKRYAGVIAQEMREALPEAVSENSSGELSVSYGNTVSLLIESIKAQQEQIEELKAEVKKLRGE